MYLPHHLGAGTGHVLADLEVLPDGVALEIATPPAPTPHAMLQLGKHGRRGHRTPSHGARGGACRRRSGRARAERLWEPMC